ncbi:MAG TPA: sodium:calcium antiporter [Candidatus Paceibacterota bacterium]|nr:sodium:calcium antiporter [Candidatus Paceibacterota bacterium]
MLENLFIFVVSAFLIIKGATLSTKYAFQIADSFKISKYVVGFIIVAIISIIPETFVSINSAIAGVPSLGLGTLFGSNIADLTLVFVIIILIAGRGIKVESKILKNNTVYPFFLLIPIVLGLDGYYSRWEGLGLIIAGVIFYYMAFKNGENKQNVNSPVTTEKSNRSDSSKNIWMLIFSLAMLLIGSHFIVTSTVSIATAIGISSVVLGMLVLGIGTTMPELFFCLSAVKENHDSLAIGDILGTVLADATIVVGILALISPFAFPRKIIYITGMFMVVSAFMLFYFMRSGKLLSKKESYLLFFFWAMFVFIEVLMNTDI